MRRKEWVLHVYTGNDARRRDYSINLSSIRDIGKEDQTNAIDRTANCSSSQSDHNDASR